MKVINSNRAFYVDWQYKDTKTKATNTPTVVTTCVVKDVSTKEVIATASVTRNPSDTHDKDKARKFSMKKVLTTIAPEDKQLRTDFWNTYKNRSVVSLQTA